MMVKHAMEEIILKQHWNICVQMCNRRPLDWKKRWKGVESGQRYYSLKLYESRAVAKLYRDPSRIKQKITDRKPALWRELEDADVAMPMQVNAYQLMRVVQGVYTYKWGEFQRNLHMAGNQGVCADLTAGPFERKNDMNFSVLCAGTRKMCSWGDDEIGVGLPIQQFEPLTEGVIQTMNYIDYPKQKEEIRASLNEPEELGVIVDDNLHYGKLGKEYVRQVYMNN